MRNEKQIFEPAEERLDFSRLERLTPRSDSWGAVCARLDAASAVNEVKAVEIQAPSIISLFRQYTAIPLAACLALVGVCALLFALNRSESTISQASAQGDTSVSINSVSSEEISSWYGHLGEGEGDDENGDDYEILDNATTISYLMKE